MPGDILPIAQANGLMVELGNWVLDEACRNMREWLDNEVPITTVAINVAPVQLWQSDFVDVIRKTIHQYNLPPSRICLEMTEDVFVNFSEHRIQTAFSELRALGVRMSLDDFGSGYSSLGYLRQNLFDQLKIDKDFVSNLSTDPVKQYVFDCILTLASNLQLEVVAEGVETESDMRYIVASECDVLQGYYLAHPAPAAQIADNLNMTKRLLSQG